VNLVEHPKEDENKYVDLWELVSPSEYERESCDSMPLSTILERRWLHRKKSHPARFSILFKPSNSDI
jgi:hypothetical protein